MTNQSRISVLLLLIALAVVVALQLTRNAAPPAAADASHTAGGYTVSRSFESGSLNRYMLISHTVRFSGSDPAKWPISVIQRQLQPNPDPTVIAHGNAARSPIGWAFVQLRNETNQSQQLVLSMPHYRCNKATLFAGRGDGLALVGTVATKTPLGNRFFSSLNLAFPVALPPRATVPLLLRTESQVGFHEVDVRLSRRGNYLEAAFIDTSRNGVQVVICLLMGLVALIIGWRADSRLMSTFGGYLLSLSGAFSCLFGYLFFFDYPSWASINAATLGTLFRLGIGITVHPFFYEVVKPAIRNRRRYKQIVTGFCLVSACVISLHLMPYRYYHYVNYSVNLAMTSLDALNLCWLFFFSFLAWYRASIWSMLVVCLMLFVPVVINQVLFLLQSVPQQDSFRTPVAQPMIIILVLSYLIFEQFRGQLVTRHLLQTQVLQAQERINGLRRQEIESIGRNLHDQVGNTLATVLGYLGRSPVDTDRLRPMIIGAINELRFMSHNLVKDDERPLSEKVTTLVSRFNDFSAIQLSVADYTHGRIDQLSALKQQNMYSIIQELLTNIIRHSHATQAHVQFFCDDTTIDVSIEDDGIGFNWADVGTATGIGIRNIYKRASIATITVRFDPAPSGTTILLKTLLTDADPNDSY